MRKRIAVLEVEEGYTRVSMISERARGVIRVVKTWEHLRLGEHGYTRARREAEGLAAELNDTLLQAARAAHEQMEES
jgi:hypothetical protein